MQKYPDCKEQAGVGSGAVWQRQISEAHHWTKETIAERQKGLSKLALKAWPL